MTNKINKISIRMIKVKNFKGVDNFESNVIENDFFKLVKPNGWGKTSILEAINYMLTKKDLNNKTLTFQSVNTPKKPYIEIQLKHSITPGTTQYFTTLIFKDNKYFINNEEFKVTEYFLQIKKIIGIENTNYLYSMLSSHSLLELTPIKKYELIISLFDSPNIIDLIVNSESFLKDIALHNINDDQWFSNVIIEAKQYSLQKVFDKVKELKSDILKLNNTLITIDNYLEEKYPNVAFELKTQINKEIEQKQLFHKIYGAVKSIFLKFINKEIKKQNLSFRIDFLNEKEEEKFLISYKNIPFDSLNNAQKIALSIELSAFLQKQYSINLPILIDGAESLDSNFFNTNNYSNQLILMAVGN